MPRHRQPLSKARLTGADRKDPGRYRGRSEPAGGGAVGNPPAYLDADAKASWLMFTDMLPWLTKADRAVLEAASILRARVILSGEPMTGAFVREYRGHLAVLGATPVDRQRVAWKPDDDETDPFGFLGSVN